jgi:predicted amidohydrolase
MFRVGFVQFQPVRYDVQKNITALQTLLAGQRADLLVLPELANSGYLYGDSVSLATYAEPGDGSGPFLRALQALAAQTGALLVVGFAEQGKGGLYNSAAALSAEGVLHVYRKAHLFAGEKALFFPGDSGFQVLKYRQVRIGMMICFDWIFPEAARNLALQGAQIIAHPANLVLPYCQQSMRTRSLENGIFSITANRYGPEELNGQRLEFTGASQVVDPRGVRLIRAPAAGDCVEIVEIDPRAADDKHITPQNDLFGDRRPELYRNQ